MGLKKHSGGGEAVRRPRRGEKWPNDEARVDTARSSSGWVRPTRVSSELWTLCSLVAQATATRHDTRAKPPHDLETVDLHASSEPRCAAWHDHWSHLSCYEEVLANRHSMIPPPGAVLPLPPPPFRLHPTKTGRLSSARSPSSALPWRSGDCIVAGTLFSLVGVIGEPYPSIAVASSSWAWIAAPVCFGRLLWNIHAQILLHPDPGHGMCDSSPRSPCGPSRLRLRRDLLGRSRPCASGTS